MPNQNKLIDLKWKSLRKRSQHLILASSSPLPSGRSSSQGPLNLPVLCLTDPGLFNLPVWCQAGPRLQNVSIFLFCVIVLGLLSVVFINKFPLSIFPDQFLYLLFIMFIKVPSSFTMLRSWSTQCCFHHLPSPCYVLGLPSVVFIIFLHHATHIFVLNFAHIKLLLTMLTQMLESNVKTIALMKNQPGFMTGR